MTLLKDCALAAALFGLAACASGGSLSDTERYALHAAHAGAPMERFRYSGSINGWTPLGNEAIAVWTRPSQAYLLDLSGPCPDIESAPAIGITHHMGQVSARFDKVLVHNRGTRSLPCHIRQIRPLDVKAVRQAGRSAREAAQPPSGT